MSYWRTLDVNVNGCVKDTPTPPSQQQPLQGLAPGTILIEKKLCSEGDRFDFGTSQCISNEKPLPNGDCVSGYRHFHDHCIPVTWPYNGLCIAGRHLDTTGKVCVEDAPVTTGGGILKDNTNRQLVCDGDFHYSAKKGGCVRNTEPLDDGSCAPGWGESPVFMGQCENRGYHQNRHLNKHHHQQIPMTLVH